MKKINIEVSVETLEKCSQICGCKKFSPDSFFEKNLSDYFALCEQGSDFEVSIRNGIFRTVTAKRFVCYGETVSELLENMENIGDNSDAACIRRQILDIAYKYGEWDNGINEKDNRSCRPFI